MPRTPTCTPSKDNGPDLFDRGIGGVALALPPDTQTHLPHHLIGNRTRSEALAIVAPSTNGTMVVSVKSSAPLVSANRFPT